MFNTVIYDSNPTADFVYAGVINLHEGIYSQRQILIDKEVLFSRVPKTVKSELTFVGAEKREGFINIYYIKLESGDQYIFAAGNVLNKPIVTGGNFEAKKFSDAKIVSSIQEFINDYIKETTSSYNSGDSVGVSNFFNDAIGQISQRL